MPVRIQMFTYACSICGQKFTHIIEEIAIKNAADCEKLGSPTPHKYPVGTSFTGQMLGHDEAYTWSVINLEIEYHEGNHGHSKWHESVYRVQCKYYTTTIPEYLLEQFLTNTRPI